MPGQGHLKKSNLSTILFYDIMTFIDSVKDFNKTHSVPYALSTTVHKNSYKMSPTADNDLGTCVNRAHYTTPSLPG